MKYFITILFIFFYFTSLATNYYFSNAGNDGNAGTIGSPWATIAKFNSVFASRAPGDFMLFNRGDVFYGSMIISRSGSSGSPITIGAYGSGANPIITGFTTVAAWTNLGANIWESTAAVSTLATCNMVSINGVNVTMGRYPNTGFFTFQSHSGTTSITSSSLNSSVTNWTGAQVVIRIIRDVSDRGTITSASGGTINFSGVTNTPNDGWGFFIQNDVRTLDAQNEWYYNPSTKKIRIYSTVSPTNVQAASVSELVVNSSRNYITFEYINFSGSNLSAIHLTASHDIVIQNCNFSFTGQDGVQGDGITYNVTATNNTLTDCSNAAIASYDGAPDVNWTITGNTTLRVGLNLGARQTRTFGAIHSIGNDCLIQNNNVDSSGYSGIQFINNRVRVINNFVNHSCMSLDDGAGIYTNGTGTQKVISGNIVLNSTGNSEGTNRLNEWFGSGIYLDDNSVFDTVVNNTCANNSASGILLHNAANILVRNNTCYNNYNIAGTGIARGAIFMEADAGSATPFRNNKINSNIFFSREVGQYSLFYWNQISVADAKLYGTSDSNYFAKPINATQTLRTFIGSITTFYNLAQWKTFSAQDVNSATAPISISNVNQLDFEYNATQNPVVKTLPPGIWIDVRGVNYSGTTTLQPYTSLVLINTGVSNTAPTANAGIDQTIQLPTSSVNFSGSGNDPDGSIVSYAWTKVSGTGGTITNPNSASTSVTGLTAGVYQYKLTVTDNLGATGSDNIIITVNAANLNPTANAGSDQAITLPTSTTTLTGSANDPDGSITAYAWTRISGPNTPTIVSASSASTSVTGLIAGTYVFRLTVTDNQTATGFDEMQVIVSNSPNIAPTADAGVDLAIQLPVSSVNLVGSGNDPDGTIAGYLWTKVSGGAASITSASSASTSVTGLVQGVYQFKLTVTDNGGLTGSDIMVVTVSAANISPTANAGTDQTITLPTSTVTLSGSANDVDGSVSSHLWTKISGTGGTITTAANYSTTVTGLGVGTYIFRLTATDNQGATGFDEMTVTVNSAVNINPTANAGTDQTTTWPTNSLTLSGSGSDADGSIVSYVWSKFSGPAPYGITNAGSPTANVDGLDIGTYQFQLLVTDNSGGTATDLVQVVQNPGAASLNFFNLTQTYTGSPLSPTLTTTPAGISTSLTLGGTTGGKIPAGTYNAIGGITDSHWSFTPVSATFTIDKATAVINASNQTFNYDGLQHTITATTTPSVSGLTYSYSSGAAPVAIGVYDDTIRLVNANYQAAQVIVTITIVSNPSIIFISDTDKVYNTTPQAVTVTSAWPYSLTYNGSVTVPTAAGDYLVQADINDGIHTGSASATMTIAKQPAVLSWAQPVPMPYGSQLTTLILNAQSNISGTWTYNYPLGTILPIGTTGLSATFTPTDQANYSGGVITTTINIFGVNPFLDYFISSNGQFFFIEQ